MRPATVSDFLSAELQRQHHAEHVARARRIDLARRRRRYLHALGFGDQPGAAGAARDRHRLRQAPRRPLRVRVILLGDDRDVEPRERLG